MCVVTTSTMQMVHSNQQVSGDTRKAEQLEASKVLGVQTTVFLDAGPEQELDAQPRLKLITLLDKFLAEGQYDELYVPLPSYNQDHVQVYEACITACRPSKVDNLRIVAYEQAMQCVGPQVCNQLHSVVYERLTHDQLLSKLWSISAHRSQIEGRSHTIVGTRGALFLAQLRGLEIGADYAEKFYLIRETR